MSDFKREERYIVVKLKHLAGLQVAHLRNFLRENSVPTIDCVVVEHDWPEYEQVWRMIERRVTGLPNELVTLQVWATELQGELLLVSEERDHAKRNSSAFEESMGDLQVKNGKLADELAALREELAQTKDVLAIANETLGWFADDSRISQQRLADADRRNAELLEILHNPSDEMVEAGNSAAAIEMEHDSELGSCGWISNADEVLKAMLDAALNKHEEAKS